MSAQASGECSDLPTGKPCLPASPRPRMGTEGPGFRQRRAPRAQSPWREATRMWWVANRMGRRVLAILGHRLDGPHSRESRKPLRKEVQAVGADLVSRSLGESRMLQFRDKDPRPEGNEKHRSPTRILSALIAPTNAFPPLLHRFRCWPSAKQLLPGFQILGNSCFGSWVLNYALLLSARNHSPHPLLGLCFLICEMGLRLEEKVGKALRAWTMPDTAFSSLPTAALSPS